MPSNSKPSTPLAAIATDLLAQVEAQHRTATRLEYFIRQVTNGSRERSTTVLPAIDQIREQVRAMRDLSETERALLDEIERELTGVSS